MKQNNSCSQTAYSVFVPVLVVFTAILASLTLLGVIPMQPVAQAAVVDGFVITVAEVEQTYDQLPANIQSQYTQDEILDQLIEKQLVLAEAQRRGITVSDEQLNAFIESQVESLGIDAATLEVTLEQAGVSLQEYEQAVREELILREFVESQILTETGENQSLAMQNFQELVSELRSQATIEVFV